jgi:hypothetical protein
MHTTDVSAQNSSPEGKHRIWNIRAETHLCPPYVDIGRVGILELRNTALRRNGLSTLTTTQENGTYENNVNTPPRKL